MPEVIYIPNYTESNIIEEGELNANLSAAQADATMLSVDGMSALDYLVFDPRSEISEVLQISSIAGQVVTNATNFSFAHNKHSRVIKVFGHQLKIYRAANVSGLAPADASFSLLATVDTDFDQEDTKYTDSAGSSDYWYKFTYYNYQTSSQTSLGLATAIRGGGYGHYVSVEDVRGEAGLNNAKSISDELVASRRKSAESEVKGVLAAVGYTLPLVDSAGTAYTPPIIEEIARKLAAGMLLSKAYGMNGGRTAKEADKKKKEARAQLKLISSGKLLLLDATETQLAYSTDLDGWPDETTEDAAYDGGAAEPKVFTMNKVY